MFGRVRQSFPLAALLLLSGFTQTLAAQTHVVNPSDLQNAAVAATQVRQDNADTVNRFLATPQAEKAMKDAHIDAQEVKSAVSSLSDEELANISARASKAQKDFAAGVLTERDFIIIILAVVLLILLIVVLR